MTDRQLNDKGYVEIHAPNHPLCTNRRGGWVLEHRVVLYGALGPDDQPCYWCGHLMPWKAPGGYKFVVNVDHLNEDRQDNRIANLVPSCWWCNANRSWSRTAPRLWHAARRELAHLPPNDRPAAILWMAAKAEALLTEQDEPNAPAAVIANYLETGDGRTLAHYQEQT